jgi:indolepyruvate ferredoxin oxidoreductase
MLKAFKLLSSVRRIRNTWIDPFARTHERKVGLAWLNCLMR